MVGTLIIGLLSLSLLYFIHWLILICIVYMFFVLFKWHLHCKSAWPVCSHTHMQHIDKGIGPPAYYTYRNCLAMETHAVKLLVHIFCADVNARGGLDCWWLSNCFHAVVIPLSWSWNQGRLQNFFIGVAIWGPLKIFRWHTKNRMSSFIMLWSNIGYMKNIAKKRERK